MDKVQWMLVIKKDRSLLCALRKPVRIGPVFGQRAELCAQVVEYRAVGDEVTGPSGCVPPVFSGSMDGTRRLHVSIFLALVPEWRRSARAAG